MTGTGVLLCGILFCFWQRLVLVGFLEFLHGIIVGCDDVFFHGIILADMVERIQIDRLRLLRLFYDDGKRHAAYENWTRLKGATHCLDTSRLLV